MSGIQSLKAFEIRDGVIGLEKLELEKAFRDFETPFYFYNLDHVQARTALLKKALVTDAGLPTSIHYAMKAIANPALLGLLKKFGLQVDVVSIGEVRCARANGFESSDILFSGVAKSAKELREAIELGVKQINVESLGELERIEKLALEIKPARPVSIGLRLNPNVSPETHPYITTGLKENKFGLEIDAVHEAVDRLKKTKASIRFRGLSLHIGSQLLDLTALDEALAIGMRVQRELAEKVGTKLDRFDAGGGIGINYDTIDESQECSVIHDYGQLLKKHLAPEIASGRISELLIEPGRWLVARSGLLVTEIQYVKTTQHKSFVIVDGGMNLLIRPALYEAKHRIAPLSTRSTGETNQKSGSEKCFDVVGPICESADFLGRDVRLPNVAPGDRLAVFDAGAYGRTMASNYNQHGWPAEYVYQNGTIERCDSI
jgi:diaminopimelate decarboxylase